VDVAHSPSPCTRLGGARHTDIFPFPFPSTRPPLSAVSRHSHLQSWIVISLFPSPKQCSFPLFSLVSVTSSFPLSSDFHIPSDVSTNHISHATAKRHQSHHPIPSQIPRSPPHLTWILLCPAPHSPQLSTRLVFLSPRLASLSPPPVPCSPQFKPCARDTANHHRRSPVTRFRPLHGIPGLPDGLLFRCTC